MDADLLARSTLGLAHIAVLPAEYSWKLTQKFGKRLSTYGGAVRIYLPGFTEEADPYGGHRLFLADNLRLAQQAWDCVKFLRSHSALESVRRTRLGSDVPEFSSIRSASLEIQQRRMQTEGADDAKLLGIANRRITAIESDLKAAKAWEQQLSDEHHLAEERAQLSEAQHRAAVFRIQQLLNQIKDQGRQPDSNVPMPNVWQDFAAWVDSHLAGRVTLTQRARRELDGAEFDDPECAARCLLWLANDYRDSTINGGRDFRDFFIEPGFKNSPCGDNTFDFLWQNKKHKANWHVKNGSNIRDPQKCLRIYFSWEENSQQIIVASMPAHLSTGAS